MGTDLRSMKVESSAKETTEISFFRAHTSSECNIVPHTHKQQRSSLMSNETATDS